MKTSLERQQEFHLSQEKVLKQRESFEIQKLQNYKQELINRQLLREKFGINSDKTSNQSLNQLNCDNNPLEMNNKNNVMTEILDVISEHDSLLQFLIDKRVSDKESSPPTTPESSETAVASSASSDSLYKSGSKKPKDDKMIIEELQTVNTKLRQLVFQLFDELEKSEKDKSLLREENERLKKENNQALNSAVPELPPLEPPALLY